MVEPVLINSFSRHYRTKYGEAVGKIPIDLGVVCPNRQKGGCIFCRPAGFTPGYLDSRDTLDVQIARGKRDILKGRFRRYLAYLQQETCTALPAEELLPRLTSLLTERDCLGLILSTRPDYVDNALLSGVSDLIAGTGKECLFELGLQTIHARSLRLLNRNHGYADFTDALSRIKDAGPFEVGAHLIFGIPGESEEEMRESLTTVCAAGIDALKLHHLQVIRDTPLQQMYLRGEVELFTLQGYLDFLLRALPLIPSSVTLHRLWATAHPELLVAPKWNVLATDLSQNLHQRMIELGIHQGQAATYTIQTPHKGVLFSVPPCGG